MYDAEIVSYHYFYQQLRQFSQWIFVLKLTVLLETIDQNRSVQTMVRGPHVTREELSQLFLDLTAYVLSLLVYGLTMWTLWQEVCTPLE